MMMAYAEALDKDRLVIALDQEKAYDKIKHDYILSTLCFCGTDQEYGPVYGSTLQGGLGLQSSMGIWWVCGQIVNKVVAGRR
jgi:hypothetical protein